MRSIAVALLLQLSFILTGQTNHPDLGLYGDVTWLDDTHIRVEYDWTDDSQLLDWSLTTGSSLVRGDGYVTITNGYEKNVRAMIWRQGIKCEKITALDATPLYTPGHLNFYSNLVSYSGSSTPNPGLGAVLVSFKNFWVVNGVNTGDIGAPFLVESEERDYEFTVSTTGMTIRSSVDNIAYYYNASCSPELDRKIALGGWGGNTRWGKLIIEGEITIPWQHDPAPADVINIQSSGSVFAPVIEVTGNPVIEWIFDDQTTSSSQTPVKDYGSTGSRHNYLKVTPWSALTGINVGYDAADGGYGDFDLIPAQNVLGFQNLNLAQNSLKYLCANHNPITELDLQGFTALEFIELFYCQSLSKLKLGSHPVLERICVEDCDIDTLNISGCPGLEDLRGALNRFPVINWGSIGQKIWHICIRDNPQLTENIPSLTSFPLLKELFTWNDNQTGPFEIHSSVISSIKAYDNKYTSADISSCTGLYRFYFSGNKLTSLNLGTADLLIDVKLKDCGLTQEQVDYVLNTLDVAGRSNGYLDLTLNASPSETGLIYLNNLRNRNWTIVTIPVTEINVTGEGGSTSIDADNGTLQLIADVLPAEATDKSVTWSLINETGEASVDENGLVTAISDGTVIAIASSGEDPDIFGSLTITISNQIVSSVVNPQLILKTIVTGDEIRLYGADEIISWDLFLYDLNGIRRWRQKVDSDNIYIDISHIPPGLYVILFTNGKERVLRKIVVN